MIHRKTLLRRIRRNRELTLENVSRQTGVHFSTLSMIERGLLIPTPAQGNALAGYFGRPLAELLAEPPDDVVASGEVA